MTTEECRNALLVRKQELRQEQIRPEAIAIERAAEALDEMQQLADRTLALNSLNRNWESSSLVSEALARIENQTYGICAECESPVSAKRLAALPWAKYCIHCQEAIDAAVSPEIWANAA